MHSVSDLTIDVEAAKSAQVWSDKMTAEGRIFHSSVSERLSSKGEKCGENLAGSYNTEKMKTTGLAVDMWYNELYDPGYDFNK